MSILLNPATLATMVVAYEFDPAMLKKLIAKDLVVPEDQVTVDYVISEVGGDPLDRFPGRPAVTSIHVTIKRPS